jgi:hypothetical protein
MSLRHQTFDSNGPEVRVRGNAWQVYEKYQSLARDAAGSGDKVLAESYLQHAEHYFRIIEAINEATAAEQRARGIQPFDQQPSVPPNYYGPDGTPNPAVPAATAPSPDGDQPPAAEPAQAEVQRRTPPTPPPFLATDEVEEGNSSNPQTLVANR